MFKSLWNFVFALSLVAAVGATFFSHHLGLVKRVNRDRFPSMRIPTRPLTIAAWLCTGIMVVGVLFLFLQH